MRRALLAVALLAASAPCFAQNGGAGVSYPPVDTSTLMPRAEAETTINGFETRIAALEAGRALALTNVTLAQTSLLSLQAAGVREFTVSTNCQVGDRMFMSPSVVLPAGYMLGDIVCTVAGTAIAKLYLPALGIGVSYSIVARVTAFR
jgi:hypothetical protein